MLSSDRHPVQTLFRSTLRRCTPVAIAVAMAVCATTASAATYYRWVDEAGITHYTSTPPQGIEAEKVTSPTRASTRPEAASATSETARASASSAGQPTPGPDSGTADSSTKDPERCKIARQRIKTIETNQRIRMKTEDGGFKYLTEEEIQEELAASQQAVKESC